MYKVIYDMCYIHVQQHQQRQQLEQLQQQQHQRSANPHIPFIAVSAFSDTCKDLRSVCCA